MSAVQKLLQLGVEVRSQGEGLRLLWHCEPTPELRALVVTHKQELLDELTPELTGGFRQSEESSALSTRAPLDEEALSEFEAFTDEERGWFFGCRAVLLEEGAELPRAERDAAAAVLQHRRLITPLSSWVVRSLLKERQAKPTHQESQVRKSAPDSQSLEVFHG